MAIEFCFSVTGEAGGRAVVFLHGFLGSHREWMPVTRDLENRFRCIAVDLPGHGQTETQDDSDYAMESTADAIITLAESLGARRFSAAGYSMGGRLAQLIASMAPERVDALVLESTSPGLRTDAERAARRESDAVWLAQLRNGEFHLFLRAWYGQRVFRSLASDPELFARMIEARDENDPVKLARSFEATGVADQPSFWQAWERDTAPVLLIVGERDTKYRAIAAEMAACRSTAEIAVIPDCGHNVHFERSKAYTEVVGAFLDRVTQSRNP
jgi:2-succinyl-6-hydroxy-2,4-cyclohexadiene-1-carboxylate synthase